MKALSVRQPWAWLLFHGKPVENRDWAASYTGPLAIAASATMTRTEYEDAVQFVRAFDPELAASIPPAHAIVRGCVVGVVNQVGCVRSHFSPFFQGPYGHVYENPREFSRPAPVKGKLGLFEWLPEGGVEQFIFGKLQF